MITKRYEIGDRVDILRGIGTPRGSDWRQAVIERREPAYSMMTGEILWYSYVARELTKDAGTNVSYSWEIRDGR